MNPEHSTHTTEHTPTGREMDWQQLSKALDTPGSVGDVYNRFYSCSFLTRCCY